MRWFLLGSLIALAAEVTYFSAVHRSHAGRKAVIAVNPDPRITWKSYVVEGELLCRRAQPDSCWVLPPGATLWLPTIRDGTQTTKSR